MPLCFSTNCNSHSHTTLGHRCIKCGELGHGSEECGNEVAINILGSMQQVLPESDWCTIPGCDYRNTHKTEDHTCHMCGLSEHNIEGECIIKDDYSEELYYVNDFTFQNVFLTTDHLKEYFNYLDNFYIKLLSEEDKEIYIRKKNGAYNYFVMNVTELNLFYTFENSQPVKQEHLDSLLRFIKDLRPVYFNYHTHTIPNLPYITPNYTTPTAPIPQTNTTSTAVNTTDILNDLQILDLIPTSGEPTPPIDDLYDDEQNPLLEGLLPTLKKCPLCREEHHVSQVLEVKGNDSKCVVCYSNDVRNFFSICGHACVCDECFTHL